MILKKIDLTTCSDIKPYEDSSMIIIIKELKNDIKKLKKTK